MDGFDLRAAIERCCPGHHAKCARRYREAEANARKGYAFAREHGLPTAPAWAARIGACGKRATWYEETAARLLR